MGNRLDQWFARLHTTIGGSGVLTRLAIKVRNQTAAIVRKRLNTGWLVSTSGEVQVIHTLAPLCTSLLDAGANVGDFTDAFLLQARPDCQAMLYEPGRHAFAALRRRFGANRNCELRNICLGDHAAQLIYHEKEPCAAVNCIVSGRPTGGDVYNVAASTVDLELQRRNWSSLDFLKIDCEGYDGHIISGSQMALAAGRIKFVLFEYAEAWLYAGATLHHAWRLLSDNSYTPHLLKDNGLWAIDLSRYGEYYGYSVFLAVRNDLLPVVSRLQRGSL